MHQYAIVTDAASDLSEQLVAKYGVEVIPMDLTIQGEALRYGPGVGISPADFYARLREGQRSQTSQINPLVYKEYFEKHLQKGEDVLYLSLSSALSATFGVAQLAAKELQDQYPARKIICVDTLNACAGQGMLACQAAAQKQKGLSLEELARWVEEVRLSIASWFTVEDLNYLAQGGRLSGTAAFFGTALQIKPVLHIDGEGKLVNMDKVRGRRKAQLSLVEHLKKTLRRDMPPVVFIGHGDCLEDARALAEAVRAFDDELQIEILSVGPVIASHTGAGIVTLHFYATQR